MITLYLFTTLGIFIWGEYPTYAACRAVQVELVTWLEGKDKDLYSIDCIEVGESIQ